MKIGTDRPYPPSDLTTAKWATVPVEEVWWDALTTTQDGIYIIAVLHDQRSVSGDIYPHVVEWRGDLYLEDGHTRMVRMLLKGQNTGMVRVLRREPRD